MTTETKARETFRMLSRIYGILFISIIVVLVIASLIVSNKGHLLPADPNLYSILKFVAIGIAIIALPLAWAYPQNLIKKISEEWSLVEKMEKYRDALFFRFAVVESAAILVSILFLLIGDTDLMLVLAIILLFYILSRPTLFKAAADLELTEEEKKQLTT